MKKSQATKINLRNEFGLQSGRFMEDTKSLFNFQSERTGQTELSGKHSGFIFYGDQSTPSTEKSTNGKSASCAYDYWFSDDTEEAGSNPLGERGSNTYSETIRINEGMSNRGSIKLKKETKEVMVIREGTKLMKSIGFPTVLVDVRSRKLYRSTLYYVILEVESSKHSGEIACMMVTSSTSKADSIQSAELLPMKNETAEPLLLNKTYLCIFEKGCTFKIKALKYGRSIDRMARKWKHYDMEKWTVQELLRRLLYVDIQAMPRYMLIGLEPVLIGGLSHSNSPSFLEYLSSDECEVSSVSTVVSPLSDSQERITAVKLSSLQPNLRLRGVTASGGSSFARWFDVIPPNIQVDEDFACDKYTKLKRDRFLSTEELDKYLSISEIL